MQADYIIIGQGISGTMLSWFLEKEGKSHVVMDNGNEDSSSKMAAGIINPVTGRRYVQTWMIDEVMPFAVQVYEEMGRYLESEFIFRKSVIDFFPSPQMREAFIDRISGDDTFLHSYPDQNYFNQYFHYDFGCGEISPAYMVHLRILLASWQKHLMEKGNLIQHDFDCSLLRFHADGISYDDITAQKIIFCDGIGSMNNQWFHLLPFSANKGEALLIECGDLDSRHLFKKGLMLVPTNVQDIFWVGSNYKWEFNDDKPSEEFYKQATTVLNNWLKKPYKVLFHKAALRPATLERRPFVGMHPHHPAVGILNGMGTKGTSLAPFFASQLVQQLVHGLPVQEEASVHRFSRILAKR